LKRSTGRADQPSGKSVHPDMQIEAVLLLDKLNQPNMEKAEA
jgi:hypothetical protein